MNIEQLIINATEHIDQIYFQLPIDGKEEPIYRERVYCYELYHQLRCIWPTNAKYMLGGEVDKEGHPLIRGNNLDRTKPDLLIHTPGNMSGNHAIIEVKPINKTEKRKIVKDLKTLTAFRRLAGYRKAIYLFYGDGDINRLLKRIHGYQSEYEEDEINLNLIKFWWHPRSGFPACQIRNTSQTCFARR